MTVHARVPVLIAAALATLVLAGTRAPAQCVGDCNGNGEVTIGELIKGVNIALDRAQIADCPSFDVDHDGKVAVNELITAVRRALAGCQPTTCAPGLEALSRGDLRTAAADFGECLADNPNDPQAHFFAAMTQGTARVLDSADGRDLAARAGITIEGDSSDVCAIHATFPQETLPSSPRTSEYLDAIRRLVRPEIEHVLTELGNLDPAVTINLAVANLPPCVRGHLDLDSVEIDQGDLLVARSGLETALALLDLLDGYNSDASLHEILDGTPQQLFAAEPQLLTLQSADKMASSATHFNAAAGLMVQAIDSVRAETDDQSNDIVVIEANDVDNARAARLMLTLFQQALVGEVSLPIDIVTGDIDLLDTGLGPHERLNLAKLFTGQFPSLRVFLPPFNDRGNLDNHHFPDPTFGGTAPDLTQNKIDNFLVGGPACALCTDNSDCNAYDLGRFYCGYCFENCQDFEQRRCSDGFNECSDGTYG